MGAHRRVRQRLRDRSRDGEHPYITGSDEWEFRNGTPVRVQIAMDVTQADAVLALRTIADSVERGF